VGLYEATKALILLVGADLAEGKLKHQLRS